MRRAVIVLTVLLVALGAAGPGGTAAATPKVNFNDIETQVMCVSCNVPLNIAESPQAEQEREFLRGLVAQGLTRQEILDRMVAVYGQNVLAQPPGKGFDLVAWIVPIGAAVGLIALGLLLLPRWRRRRRDADAAAVGDGPGGDGGVPALDPEEERRLAEDMARSGA
jgi:cytochrome c-type biogenesis protein CcmH